MDIFSIIFGWYFENIERGVKWCFADGRLMRACGWYMGFVLFGFFTFYNHYDDILEAEEAKQAALYEQLRRDRDGHQKRREAEFMIEVKAVLGRRKDESE